MHKMWNKILSLFTVTVLTLLLVFVTFSTGLYRPFKRKKINDWLKCLFLSDWCLNCKMYIMILNNIIFKAMEKLCIYVILLSVIIRYEFNCSLSSSLHDLLWIRQCLEWEWMSDLYLQSSRCWLLVLEEESSYSVL